MQYNKLYDIKAVFHVKHFRALVWAGLVACAASLSGCEAPSDVILDPPAFVPVQDQDGRYRVTSGSGPEVVRGFLPDGRLLFRTFDLPPFGPDWVLVSAPLDGGRVREELAVYRPALLDDMSHLAHDGARRVLVLWKAAVPGVHGCPDSSLTTGGTPGPAPRTPSPVGVTLFALPAADGTPIAAIPSRFVSTNLVQGAGTMQQRVRVFPTHRDVDRTGANAFGPVLLPGTDDLVYSDGEFLWRASISDTSATPTLIGPGSYPTISAGGTRLAYARPLALDSVVTTYSIPVGITVCVEEHVEVSAGGWAVVIRDLEAGTEAVVAAGFDPAFDPLADRLVVRGPDLRYVELTSGTITPILATVGAFAPAFSPDGQRLAFSLINPVTGADTYFLLLNR